MIEVITRSDAGRLGLRRYFTGSPCKYGHVSERYTKSRRCIECATDLVRKKISEGYWRQHYDENKEAILERIRRYRAAHSEDHRKKAASWAAANPEARSIISKNYKHRRRTKEKGGISTKDLSAWILSQSKICYWCGVNCAKNFHIDHYEPISKGGKHDINNLVASCSSCNLRKSASDPYQFAVSMGRLF